MPDRVTEADLARWEALSKAVRNEVLRGGPGPTFMTHAGTLCAVVPALVNEVRRLQQFIEIAALALEDTGHRTGAQALRRGALTHSLMKPADA